MYFSQQCYGGCFSPTRLCLAALCGLIFLVAPSEQAVSSTPPSTSHSRRNDILGCLTSQDVPFVVPGSPNWTAHATPYNLRVVYQPAVITIPETPEQVGSSITCAAEASLRVQAKGGGHSFAGYSSGGQDGSLIVDMEKFAAVELDPETFVARIGAGQRIGNIATQIYKQGKRALPHGTCSSVGIAGHALHGGYGLASRKWGLTLDTIVGLDVVLANGTQVHTTAEQYPDLFYAFRGAPASFGIVTYLYLQTQPAPSSVMAFLVTLDEFLKGDVETVTTGFEALQNFALTSPLLTPNITFNIETGSEGQLSIFGWCLECDAAVLKSTILPAMLAGFPDPERVPYEIKKQFWIQALHYVGNVDELETPLGHEYADHDMFYSKSLVTSNARPLTRAAIKSFWSYVLANQQREGPFQGPFQGPFRSIINLYGAPGSAINAPDPQSSAYSDRDGLWMFHNEGYSADKELPFDPALFQLVDGLNAAVEVAQPDGNFTGYMNYVDPRLDAMAAAQRYYGAETYNRLLKMKTELDPASVFWNPQAIGNSAALPM